MIIEGQNLEDVVVQFEKINTLEFLPTDRLTKVFTVTDEKVFAKNYYGNLETYDIHNGKKISTFYFKDSELKDIANDGVFLYLAMEKDFDLKDDDTLLTNLSNRDFKSELIGTSHRIRGKTNQNGIMNSVIAIPLKSIDYPSIVYNTSMFIEENKRFLIKGEINSLNMWSYDKYIQVFCSILKKDSINYDNLFLLKEGNIYKPSEKELELLKQETIKNRKIPESIVINSVGTKIHAAIEIDNEGDDMFMLKSHCENLNIVFKKCYPLEDHFILGLINKQNKIHVLYDQVRKNGKSGVSVINSPNQLISYKIGLKRLMDL